MDARDSQQRRAGERRRLFDRRSPFPRRSGTDRRRGERRSVNLRVARERRSGMDRRHGDRRGAAERRLAATRRVGRRRRETPTPYTVEELARVREALTSRKGPAACPSCNGAYTLGRPRRRGSEVVRQVQCLSCGRSAVVSNTWMARVLVIDEKEVVRDTLRLILSSAGHEVTEAADAGVGLQAYQLIPPDVVFIDVLSSGRMDAAEFIRRLRAEHPDARVVAMSGRPSYGTVDPLAVTASLGAVRTIRMPFSREDVLATLEEARH